MDGWTDGSLGLSLASNPGVDYNWNRSPDVKMDPP